MIVNWTVTKGCNLKCVHCCNVNQRKTWSRDMTSEQAEIVIDKLAEGGVEHVLLFGGEASIRRDFMQIAERVKAKGMQPWLTTNGKKLTDDHIERLAQIDATIAFSIDGATAETNDAIRGKDTFAQVTAALRKFAEARKRHDANEPLQVNYSLMRRNMHEAIAGVRLVAGLGATVITFTELLPFSTGKDNSDRERLTTHEKLSLCYQLAEVGKELGIILVLPVPELVLDRFRQELGDVELRTALEHRCSAGLHTCSVTNDGSLLPCGYQFRGMDRASTSLLNHSFREIYFSESFAQFIKKANEPAYVSRLDPICRHCSYRERKQCQPQCHMGILAYEAVAAPCKEVERFLALRTQTEDRPGLGKEVSG